MNLEPLGLIKKRLALSKNESDAVYFLELLLYGEFITKLIAIQLVSAVLIDKERIRYKYELNLINGNSIGAFASTIDEVIRNHSDKLLRDFGLNEGKMLSMKTKSGDWQFDSVFLLNEVAKTLNISLPNLPTKVSLRRWFSDFSVLRNKTKGHGALRSSVLATNVKLLEESITLIETNYYGFNNRFWAYLYQNLNGKYRISPISESIAPFEYLKTSTEFRKEFPNGCYCYIDKPIVVELLISSPEVDDFFVPNGNCKKGEYELISYITGSVEKVKNEKYSVPATELPSSHTEGVGKLIVQGESFGNIPPPPRIYINRTLVEKELLQQLNNTYLSPIVTLLGKGGIGKTTTALNCLHKVAREESFSIIIWFSSRDIDLLVDGPKAVKTKIFTIQDIADEYCRLLEIQKITQSERLGKFQEALSTESIVGGKTLFVFDNFETIDDPLEVYNWLYQYIRPPNKILITSRESRDFKGDYPIEIGKMAFKECEKLIDIYSNEMGVKALLTSSYIEKLINESDRHPYIIKILLGEVTKSKKLNSIERIVAGRDDILTALFRRTFSSLSHAASRVFLTLCSWRSTIPQIAIEAVLLHPKNDERFDVRDAIEELRKCSLIEIFKSETDNSNFIGVPLAASIFGKEELDIYPDKLSILEDIKLLQQFGVTQENDVKYGLLPRIEKKFREISKAIDQNPIKGKDYLKENLPILEYLCRQFPIAYTFLTSLYEELEETDNIIESIKRYIQSNPSSTEKKIAWRKLVNIYNKKGDWIAESHALSELCLIPDVQVSEISNIADRIIRHIHSQGQTDIEHKNLIFEKVAETLEKRIYESYNSIDYSRLAWLNLHLRRPEKALKFANEGLKHFQNCIHCNRLVQKISRA